MTQIKMSLSDNEGTTRVIRAVGDEEDDQACWGEIVPVFEELLRGNGYGWTPETQTLFDSLVLAGGGTL
jgi:hypothetical protein